MLLAKENNGVLVCSNPHAMQAKAKAYGLVGFDIISYNDYLMGQFDENKPIFVDELDEFVRLAQKNCLNGFTLTIGD